MLCCHIPGHSYYSWVWWCCAWNLVWQVLRCLVCSLWNLIFCSACGKNLFWEWFDVVCFGLKIMVYRAETKQKNLHSCLPFTKAAHKICLSKALILVYHYWDLICKSLAWALAIRQVKMKSYLPGRKICLFIHVGQLCDTFFKPWLQTEIEHYIIGSLVIMSMTIKWKVSWYFLQLNWLVVHLAIFGENSKIAINA